VDYWALQQLVYRQKIADVDHLKQALNSCWDMISQELIDGAIEQWSKPLSSVVCSRDGHIELLILETDFGMNFVSLMNLSKDVAANALFK